MLMYDFELDFWKPLIKASENGNDKEFNDMFSRLYRPIRYDLTSVIKRKFSCDTATAEDCVHESFLALLSNIKNKNRIKITSYNELFGYLFIIAYHKGVELIYRVPNIRYINGKDDIGYIPKYLNQPSGNVFRDIYDGKKDIDGFLKKEYEIFKLLELKIIKNYSYKKILTSEEYSRFSEVSLRQKVSRGLRKFKEFINSASD